MSVVFLLAGCGAHRTTTLPQEWTASAGDRAVLVDGGARVYTGAGKEVQVVDGATGKVVWSERERRSVGRALLASSTIGVGRAQLRPGEHEAEEYSVVVLEADGTVLVLDFTMTTDRIRAFDLGDGSALWESTDLSFTLARYGALAAALGSTGNVVGRSAARGLDEQVRAGSAFYLEDLIAPVPGQEAFLFKTRNGLSLVAARTGEVRWVAEELDGLGIAAVLEVPGTDELIVATYAPSERMPRQLARIDMATGAVRWISDYASPSTIPSWSQSLRLRLADGHVVLVGHGVEVFDFETGRKAWQSHDAAEMRRLPLSGIWGSAVAAPLIEDGALYLVDNTGRNSFRCIDRCVTVVRRYDLATGAVAWQTDPFDRIRTIHGLELVNGVLVAALSMASGIREESRVIGIDPANGAERWSSPGGRGDVRNLVVDGSHVLALVGGTLYRLDARSGRIDGQATFAEANVGGPLRRVAAAGDRLVVLGEWGLAGYAPSDLRLLYTRTFRPQDQPEWGSKGFFARMGVLMGPAKDDRVTGMTSAGDRILLYRHTGGVTVVDRATGAVVGDLVTSFSQGDRRSGPIGRRGYEISADDRYLYVMGDGEVARYQLNH